MTRDRQRLLRCLGPEARLQSSYLPGRSGFVVTSGRTPDRLKAALIGSVACRLTVLHLKSGRFFIEPNARWLARSLTSDDPSAWWSAGHQSAATRFFDPVRSERVRRLPVGEGTKARWTRGFRPLRDLALRLESLSVTPRPDKHWRALEGSFDDLWREIRWSSVTSDPLWQSVCRHLRGCREQQSRRLAAD